MITPDVAAALGNALALAGDGLPSFPCRVDKRPATPHGYQDALSDPGKLRQLWRRHPGPLVGVPTGEASGFDVLDIDAPRHPEAGQWWHKIRGKLPATRIHRSRSGGLHVLFTHAPGLRCWAARPLPGVDGRGTGGYIVWWPRFGGEVVCGAAPVPWPEWLLMAVAPLPPMRQEPWTSPALRVGGSRAERYAFAALRHAVERVALAPTGCRNETLNVECFTVSRFIAAGVLDAQQVADGLAAAALSAGLSEREIVATIASALRAAGVS